MKNKYRVFLIISLTLLLALLLDATSKAWAEQTLGLYHPRPVIGGLFRLTLGYNSGVAFGLFANGGPWPAILSGIIIFGMVIWLLQLLRSGEFPAQTAWPMGLFFGGAIANFVDRLPDGRVTDFLDVGLEAARWPTFNLADSFIVLGATILLLITLLEQRQKKDEV
jgi:signal peptidase II